MPSGKCGTASTRLRQIFTQQALTSRRRGNYRTMPTHDMLDVYTNGYYWHCNHHTFASRLVMAGMDLRTVAELLRHKTLQMVMRHAHLALENQASAVGLSVISRN